MEECTPTDQKVIGSNPTRHQALFPFPYLSFSISVSSNRCKIDDLIDIEQDVNENNITLFSYPFLYKINDTNQYLKNNVTKLINYVLNINEILNDKIDVITTDNIKIVYFVLLLLLNYGISKYDNIKSMFIDYESIFPLKFNDIYEFRKQKYNLFN